MKASKFIIACASLSLLLLTACGQPTNTSSVTSGSSGNASNKQQGSNVTATPTPVVAATPTPVVTATPTPAVLYYTAGTNDGSAFAGFSGHYSLINDIINAANAMTPPFDNCLMVQGGDIVYSGFGPCLTVIPHY